MRRCCCKGKKQMEQDTILKKDGVRLVRKRLKELLKPLGFQAYGTNRLLRIRENFIDEINLDTAGYHLDPLYFIYYRPAPFTRLCCDKYRLWRTAKMDTPYWSCEIPPNGGPYYYKAEYFEAVWRDVSCALEQHVLPHMEAMTPKTFLPLLISDSRSDLDFFRPANLVHLNSPYPGWPGTPEAAVYGVGMWRMERYEEGVPYLIHAQKQYHASKAFHEQEENLVLPQREAASRVIDSLLSLWTGQEDGWAFSVQDIIHQVSNDWINYI